MSDDKKIDEEVYDVSELSYDEQLEKLAEVCEYINQLSKKEENKNNS